MKFKSLCALGFVLCILSLLVVLSIFNFHESTEPKAFKAQPSGVISKPETEAPKPAPQVLNSAHKPVKPARTAPSATEKMKQKSPLVFVPEPAFTFEPVIDGTMIVHDFNIKNKGSEPLVLESVKTGCGCTTASYPKNIPPGGEGKITIKAYTTGYGGRKFWKNIRVNTNEKSKPYFTLSISGEVKKFVSIEPRYVKLEGPVGRQLKETVTIIPEENYSFKILEVNAVRGKEIRCNLEEIKKTNRAEYRVIVENLKKQKGRFFDTICLKTDSRVRPEIRISVYGNIK